jgi:putative Holliday junction resolvase
MRALGLDFGERRIGVAVSDELGWTASAVGTVERTGDDGEFRRIAEMAQQYQADVIVVGLPVNMDGTLGPGAEKCKAFAERLRQTLNMPVHLWDERLTTVTAERTLIEAGMGRRKRKRVVDRLAAAVMLQHYLDSRAKRGDEHER